MIHNEWFPAVAAFGIGGTLLVVLLAPVFSTVDFLSPFRQPEESEFEKCKQAIPMQLEAEGVTAKVPYRIHLVWENDKSGSPVITDSRFTIIFSDWNTHERIPSNVVYDFILRGQSDTREMHNRVANDGLDTFEEENFLHPCSFSFIIHIDSIGNTVLHDPIDDPEYVQIHGNMSPVAVRFQVIQTPTGMFGMKTIPIDKAVPSKPRISQEQAIEIADNDLRKHLDGYHGITHVIVNNTSGYVPFDEFKSKNMALPVVYVSPEGELILLAPTGYDNLGYCTDALYSYCGFMPHFNFVYEGKLVYGVEVAASYGEAHGVPFFHMVDAVNGEIVDSTFLRSEKIRSMENGQ
jgi:hypothetical protein